LKIDDVVKSWVLYIINFTISLGILANKFFNPRSSLQHGFIKIFEELHENKKEKKILLVSKSGAHINLKENVKAHSNNCQNNSSVLSQEA
jgi:hypothetical protein